MIGTGPTRTIEKSVIIKKIKKVHGWAKFVGFLYLLATLAVAAIVALVPTMEIVYPVDRGGEIVNEVLNLSALSIFDVFSFEKFDTAVALRIVVSSVYLILLLILLINIIRSLFKLGGLFRLKVKWTVTEETFNENVEAMEGMGKVFSSSFANSVVGLAFIYMLAGIEYTTIGAGMFLFIGACFAFYFFCASMSRLASRFYPHKTEREWPFWPRKQREISSGWVAFVRNIMRIALVFALLALFTQVCGIHEFVVGVLTATDFSVIFNDINALIGVALELVVLSIIYAQVGMATSQREYYLAAFIYTTERLEGARYMGIKRFLIVSILGLIVNIGFIVWTIIGGGDILLPIFMVLISVAICFIPVFMSAIQKRAPEKVNLQTEMGTVFNNYGYGEM